MAALQAESAPSDPHPQFIPAPNVTRIFVSLAWFALVLMGTTLIIGISVGDLHQEPSADTLRSFVTAYAAKLLAKSGVAQARALDAVIAGCEMALPEALRFEASLFGLCFATDDMREGTRAFIEKRKPRFPGR
jgi:enoyl-CoA hydratase